MKITKKIILPFVAILCFAACSSLSSRQQKLQGNYFTPRYAQGFCIDTLNGKKILTVQNPFLQAVDKKYTYTIDNEPLKKVVCMSTTQLAFLDFIGKTDAVVGVSGARYVFNPVLQASYQQGKIVEVGYETSLNIETLIALQPDAVLAYGIYGEFETLEKKLQELGIPVIYIGEYVEPHPLGKAEWAVAIAAFWGEEELANHKFQLVAQKYLQLKESLPSKVEKVSVLLNAPWNDSWFFPGRESNMAQYIQDAGGESVMPLQKGRDACPLSIEHVFSASQDAQCWLNPGNAADLQSLQKMHQLIARFPVFAGGNVYNNNKRNTPQGGSDFFESGTVNPHLILEDLIHILHPDVPGEHELYYYQRLQ